MTDIFIIDNLPPETLAMLQALYSRSPKSVTEHLEKVKETGSDKFMESFYVGYGHSSIGDCANTTIFFENTSFLFEKALQDNPLYNGQACSSRYLNFKTRPLTDPIKSKSSQTILNNWIDFYIEYTPIIKEHLKKQFPLTNANVPEQVWDKALNARTFDIMRGFLPLSSNTQVSWTTSLRQAHEMLYKLSFHPLSEVSDTARKTLALLKEKYPASFSHKDNPEMDSYYRALSTNGLFYNETTPKRLYEKGDFIVSDAPYSASRKDSNSAIYMNRPKWSPLPKYLNNLGNYIFDFLLDYGSFRDVQRHRNGTCSIPLINNSHGFEHWYIRQFPEDLQNTVSDFITAQMNLITELKTSEDVNCYDLQYFYPLGIRVSVELVYSLPQAVYVAELRSQQTVHQTLRVIAQKIGKQIEEDFGDVVKLYVDYSEDAFSLKRGTQDIIEK